METVKDPQILHIEGAYSVGEEETIPWAGDALLDEEGWLEGVITEQQSTDFIFGLYIPGQDILLFRIVQGESNDATVSFCKASNGHYQGKFAVLLPGLSPVLGKVSINATNIEPDYEIGMRIFNQILGFREEIEGSSSLFSRVNAVKKELIKQMTEGHFNSLLSTRKVGSNIRYPFAQVVSFDPEEKGNRRSFVLPGGGH